MRPTIKKQNIKTLLETKFIKVFDLQYAEGRHYYNATRRSADDLVAVKSTEEFQNMLPDAVSCITILRVPTRNSGYIAKAVEKSSVPNSATRATLLITLTVIRPTDRADFFRKARWISFRHARRTSWGTSASGSS